VRLLGTVVGDDRQAAGVVLVGDPDHTRGAGQDGGALRRAGLEELDDAGQALGDVLRAGDAAGVERTHRQLRTGLTDGLGGDDADGLTELDHVAGRERHAVAVRADPVGGLAGEDRADADALDRGVVAEGDDVVLATMWPGIVPARGSTSTRP
jgi:hypothetical protein